MFRPPRTPFCGRLQGSQDGHSARADCCSSNGSNATTPRVEVGQYLSAPGVVYLAAAATDQAPREARDDNHIQGNADGQGQGATPGDGGDAGGFTGRLRSFIQTFFRRTDIAYAKVGKQPDLGVQFHQGQPGCEGPPAGACGRDEGDSRQAAEGPPEERGLGASRLNLSRASEWRKQKAITLSMVAGTLSFTYVEPKHEQDMGRLVLSFMVMTMDKTGHMTLPSVYSTRSQAILRKAIRADLQAMLDERLYPVHPVMRAALTGMGESVHIFPQAAAPAAAASTTAP